MTNISLKKAYAKYPQYKDSGVEWLGEIPESWNKNYFRGFTKENNQKNTTGGNRNLLSLSYGKIIEKDIDSNGGLLPESFNTYQIVNKGDIILRLTDLQNDKKSLRVGYVEQDNGIITSAYLGLNVSHDFDKKYMYYLLHLYDLQKVFYNLGAGVRQTLDYKNMKYLSVLLPPKEEQERIARFLDERTARIDEIIAKKERLVELLKEKRTATINHAVTKGIDPNAELVDSGVEWIGKIPKGWGVDRLKDISAYCSRGGTPDYSENEDGYKFINQSCVRDGFVDLDKIKFSKTESRKGCVRKGDILINSTGTGTLGRLSVFDQSDAYFADTHITIYRTEKAYSRFVMYVIQHPAWQNYLYASSVSGSTNQIELSRNKLLEIPVIIPSRKEQINIAEYLDKQSSSFSQVIKGIERSIELLKEFKSSLISHAVTGKIKV